MLKWFNKSASNQLASIVNHTEGLAFASITHHASNKPHLDECYFQAQLSDSKTTLNQLMQHLKQIKQPVTTLLDSDSFLFLLMQRPTVEENELVDALRWQIKEQLKYPAEEAIIEVLNIPGQQERGRMPMIYVIAAHRDKVKSSAQLIESINLDLQYIDIPELAQRNISSLLPEDKKGVAILNLQANQGLLTITHEGELYLSRVIDIGYEQLEKFEQPTQTGNALTLEQSDSEINDNINKIILEIQRSLDYYESHYGKPTIGNLVMAPTENEISHLNKQLKNDLGLSVRNLNLNDILDFKKPIELELQAKCFHAIGAALRLSVDVATLKKAS